MGSWRRCRRRPAHLDLDAQDVPPAKLFAGRCREVASHAYPNRHDAGHEFRFGRVSRAHVTTNAPTRRDIRHCRTAPAFKRGEDGRHGRRERDTTSQGHTQVQRIRRETLRELRRPAREARRTVGRDFLARSRSGGARAPGFRALVTRYWSERDPWCTRQQHRPARCRKGPIAIVGRLGRADKRRSNERQPDENGHDLCTRIGIRDRQESRTGTIDPGRRRALHHRGLVRRVGRSTAPGGRRWTRGNRCDRDAPVHELSRTTFQRAGYLHRSDVKRAGQNRDGANHCSEL